MSVNQTSYRSIITELEAGNIRLVAVSKMKTIADILELYNAGQLDFGENYVQELQEKQALLPSDIRWHFIGHLQTNKVKYIAPFVHLIQGVDSLKLLQTIQKEGKKAGRKINCLLQVFVAQEETKYGLSEEELFTLFEEWKHNSDGNWVQICGIMGMASFTENQEQLRSEFRKLKLIFDAVKGKYFDTVPEFNTLSMGMSGDYKLAIEEGSTMVRIGSLLFGTRI